METFGRSAVWSTSFVLLVLLQLQDESVLGRIAIYALPSNQLNNNAPYYPEIETSSKNSKPEESHCTTKPMISLISYSRDEFWPNETVKTELIDESKDAAGNKKLWVAPYVATVEIQCVASVPIQWIFEGPLEPAVLSIDVTRDPSSDGSQPTGNDKSSNCFRVVMKLVTRKRSTGKYICSRILSDNFDMESNKSDTSMYLYSEINGPPFLLYAEKEFNVFQQADSQTVVLPCQVVNPYYSTPPKLYKGNSKIISLEGGAVPFNPEIGFTLDLQKIPNPFDQYKCSREGGSVYVHVLPLPDFRVSPGSNRLTVVEGNSLTLTCEATFPVGFEGFIDETKVNASLDDASGQYKYKISYEYNPRKIEPAGISCINLKTRATLHTWTTTLISQQMDNISGIRYDPNTKRFYCLSKTDHPPTIILAECNSVMECQLTQKCLSWDAPYKLSNGGNTCFSAEKVRVGSSCDKHSNAALNTTQGCAFVSNSINHSGIIQCLLPDNGEQVQFYYFNGIKSPADVVIFDWREAPVDELIEIHVVDPNRTFYKEEIIEFTCSVSKFVFARGQIFMFKLQDGSYATPQEIVSDVQVGEHNLIIKTSKLKLDNNRIIKVICMSPFWNQTGWMNNSVSISVEGSVPPTIQGPKKSMLVAAGSNISVPCEANGLPTPDVAWYRVGPRQGEKQPVTRMTPIMGHRGIAILNIDPVNPDDAGEYYCQASNVAGTKTVELNLDVSQNNGPVYTLAVIGVIVSIAFLAIVTVLWRKLRKNQAIIRRLTEKEEKELIHGNLSALRSIPDGYIRAEFLPYDKQYEIKEENLKLGEEVIGEGEYGIVVKAMLCNNDSTREVAVKTRRTADVNHYKALFSELKMMTYIGWHDNVINLLGAVTTNLRNGDVYIVMEYCRLGSLEKYLRNNRASFLNQIMDDKIDLNLNFNFNAQQAYQPMEYTMRTADLISWAYQIASGMEYLASKKVTHGDLAARNLLLTEDRTIKIIDFGLSKYLWNGSNYVSHSNMNIPWQHSAPETFQNIFSTQSDVWSMGVTLWEVFSLGSIPYAGIPCSSDFKNKLLQGLRLEKPETANKAIYNVMLKCWKNVPAERISFVELKQFFHRLLHHWAEESSEDSDDVNVNTPLTMNMGTLGRKQFENHYVPSPTNQQQQRAAHYATVA